MTTHPCGCVTAPDPTWVVTRAVSKCAFHVQYLKDQPTGEAYYRSIHVLGDDGLPRFDAYVAEVEAALRRPFPPPPPAGRGPAATEAIEVGCGVSPYVRAVEAAGYRYTGIDRDVWAVNATLAAGLDLTSGIAEDFDGTKWADGSFGLVLAAHCLEHLDDMPGVLRHFYRMLVPGGHLVIVVPDDTDLTNPDHRWFFTPATLALTLGRLGFAVAALGTKRVVEHELFIYCHARKPEAP